MYSFPADGAHPYKRDLPEVEFHLFDTGHFVLEDKADEVVPLIRDFLKRAIRFGLDAAPVANIAHEFRDGCGACLFCS